MSEMIMAIAVVKTLDAKALSEIALAMCLGGALVVWVGIRFDRNVFRWAGMSVIVIGLLGLIFQNSLSRQTLAASAKLPTVPAQAPSPSPSPSPTPTHAKKKPKKKPTHKPAPPTGGGTGGGGFSGPPSQPPSQPPLPPVQGSPLPPGG